MQEISDWRKDSNTLLSFTYSWAPWAKSSGPSWRCSVVDITQVLGCLPSCAAYLKTKILELKCKADQLLP
jgi:hypothetical protein